MDQEGRGEEIDLQVCVIGKNFEDRAEESCRQYASELHYMSQMNCFVL